MEKQEKHVCCICGKEFYGWGNNPYGAIGENGKPVEWDADDICCDECNMRYVIPGRIYLINQNKK